MIQVIIIFLSTPCDPGTVLAEAESGRYEVLDFCVKSTVVINLLSRAMVHTCPPQSIHFKPPQDLSVSVVRVGLCKLRSKVPRELRAFLIETLVFPLLR